MPQGRWSVLTRIPALRVWGSAIAPPRKNLTERLVLYHLRLIPQILYFLQDLILRNLGVIISHMDFL